MKVSEEDGFLSRRACLSLTVILIQSAQTFAIERKYSVWIGEPIRSRQHWAFESTKQLRQSFSDPLQWRGNSEERILTLRTEPPRFEIHRREVSSMLQQSKRLYDAQRAEALPKRSQGSVAKRRRVQADPLFMSRRSTLQNASLKEPSESTEYPWRESIPAEELTTDSVPLPEGPIAMWQAAMITSYDLMMIEFTGDKASSHILQRTKHTSVAKIFVRDQPQSVRFMIIVSDPLNLSQREVIIVTREVTETTPLICSPQAPLEMVLMKPLSPRPKEKPLFRDFHAGCDAGVFTLCPG